MSLICLRISCAKNLLLGKSRYLNAFFAISFAIHIPVAVCRPMQYLDEQNNRSLKNDASFSII